MASSTSVITIRCHHCSHFIGESDEPLELVGIVKDRVLKDLIPPPRKSWRCRCGWINVFAKASAQPLARTG